MSLPQVGDLVRLINNAAGVPYEKLLGMVVGYETKGVLAGRAKVVWVGTGSPAADGEILCYSPNRLQVVE
jgi:hypothetical protein